MERKALGKGIAALIPQKEETKHEIIYIETNKIRPNPFQPREDFDMQSIEELAQSIKEKGIIQPLLVRRKADSYELIAGERRLRACNLLGINEIPAIIKDVNDQDALEYALIENIQRQNLNPIEEAHAYQHLMEKFNLTQEKISEGVGKSRAAIANVLRLLQLPYEIQEEIKKGRISYAHGRTLLEVDDANLQRKLAQEVIAKNLSVRELENLVKTKRPFSKRTIRRNIKPVDPYLTVLEEDLQRTLSTKVKIIKRQKRGHILIEFYSPEDLTRIVKVIKREG